MKKIKIDNALMIIAIVLIFSYICYEAYSVTHIQLKTETAVVSTVYEKIDATALVIRDEHTIANAQSGVTVPALADGDKINVGGNVAMTFASSEEAVNYSKYAELQNQLSYYENLEAQTLGHSASVESINAEIDNKVDDYIRAVSTKNPDVLQDAGEKVNDSLLRRQMIIGENVDLVAVIQDLRQQMEQYAASSKPSGYITTDTSGVFSSYTDGYEDAFDYSSAEQMTAEQIEEAINQLSGQNESEEESSYLGKLITSYAWYLECVVDAQTVRDLKDGSSVKVALKDSDDTVLTATIISGADVNPGQEKTALILKCSTMNSKLASLRKADIELRIKKYEGIKLPAGALHISGDKKGVYALVSSQVYFREVEVVYSQDDFVMVKYDQNNPDGIRLYDKIITQGKELEDGKVFN